MGVDLSAAWQIIEGDALEVMRTFEPDTFDAIVTDPPYSLGFLGKAWDTHRSPHDFERWCEAWGREALRVAKPGAHLLAFGGTRAWHRLVCGLEDAEWEIRDGIALLGPLLWVHGVGFPKSLDVSKAIDKGDPLTDAARTWNGWGTALKPAFEPIAVARKSLAGTVADNVQRYGTGALNIDGCRVGPGETRQLIVPRSGGKRSVRSAYDLGASGMVVGETTSGRWPANVILACDCEPGEEHGELCAVRLIDEASGEAGAARFFYTAKARGVERQGAAARRNPHPTVKPLDLMRWLVKLVTRRGGLVLDPFAGSGTTVHAALLDGCRAVGIERDPEMAAFARERVAGPLFADGG